MALEDTQVPAPEAPPQDAPAPEPTAAGGPWQQDIEQSFTDPQVRATVDAFLRSKIQPRMTQLEQQIAAAENARQLWDAFQEDPLSTYQAIQAELEQAGYEVGGSQPQPQPDAPAAQTYEQEPNALPPSDPRFEEMYAEWQERRELEAYDAEVAKILADPANKDINAELFHGFVAAADGDFDAAVGMYREDMARRQTALLDELGLTPEQLAELQAAKREQAPPTIGDEGSGAVPTVPERKGVRGLEEAVDDLFTKLAPSDAPPVLG